MKGQATATQRRDGARGQRARSRGRIFARTEAPTTPGHHADLGGTPRRPEERHCGGENADGGSSDLSTTPARGGSLYWSLSRYSAGTQRPARPAARRCSRPRLGARTYELAVKRWRTPRSLVAEGMHHPVFRGGRWIAPPSIVAAVTPPGGGSGASHHLLARHLPGAYARIANGLNLRGRARLLCGHRDAGRGRTAARESAPFDPVRSGRALTTSGAWLRRWP